MRRIVTATLTAAAVGCVSVLGCTRNTTSRGMPTPLTRADSARIAAAYFSAHRADSVGSDSLDDASRRRRYISLKVF